MSDFRRTAASITPGTKVFCGEPLMKGTPSSMHASAMSVEGDTSASPARIAARRFSSVSLTPTTNSLYLSVLAVHSTTTLSTPELALKSLMSARI